MEMLEQLKAKYRFWYADRFIKHGKHYEYMFDLSNTKSFAVRLLKKYPGVIVEYSNIFMKDDYSLSYDFNVIANVNNCDVNSKRFQNFSADIFRSMINDSVKTARETNEDRNTNSIESDAQRIVHEEDVAVSEERVPDRKPRKKAVRGNKAVRSKVQQPSTEGSTGDQS